ncbi:MAG: YfhO family protein [Lachnospiraceae bacterium]|nr:YfhO family protein [Lachnospiraceae bacterium]
MKIKTKKSNILTGNIALLLAFLAPIFILICLFIAREIFPFGEEMYLRSDMYHQYAPFLKLFQTALKEGRSLEYTFHMGLGSNMVSAYAYYLSSPINWLVALLPSSLIPEIMGSFIILKAGLMSATFTYYLTRKFHNPQSILAACFGIFYALSGYMAAYSWNLMWLDNLILLPLIILGLERLVRKKKVLLFTISLALSVICNYYISIMICFYLVFYFVYLLIETAGKRSGKETGKSIARFAVYSVLGGCIGAAVVLPAFLALFGTASAGSGFPSSFHFYFNPLEMFAHGMMNAKVTMISEGYVPNIYAGIFTFALVPLFFLNAKVPVKQRIGKVVLILVLWISFALNVLAYIWHGFHLPNSLPARHSFIYIFLILTICYEVMLRIKQYAYWQIVTAFLAGILAVFLLQYLYKDSYTVEQAVLNAGFLLAYLIILALQKRDLPDKEGRNAQTKQVFRILLFVFLMILCVAETSINANETGYSTTDRVAYTEDNADIEELLDSVDDGSFFRVEKAKRRTKNDGAWSDYRSASVFSSTTLKGLSKIYASFGMQSGTNSFSYYGNTPFTSALLGVKYKLSDSAIDDPMWEYVKGTEKAFLYQAKYVLPLGFMVKNTTQAEVNPDGSDPFLIQNNLINAACGAGPVFQIKGTLSGERIELEIEEDVRKLIYIQDKLDNLKVDVYRNGSLYINRNFTALECKLIVDLGEFQKGDRLVIYTTDSEKSSISLIEADLDKQAFAAAMEAMGSNPWVITEAKDGYLKGTVQAQASKMTLFTTIPYEKGWNIYVDGKKAAYKGFYNAFIQIPLEKEGMHEVEMIYHAPGLVPGLIISAASLILFIILCLIKKKKQSKKSLK